MSWESHMQKVADDVGLTFEHHTTPDDIEVFDFRKGGKYFRCVSGIREAFYWLEGYKDGVKPTECQPSTNGDGHLGSMETHEMPVFTDL